MKVLMNENINWQKQVICSAHCSKGRRESIEDNKKLPFTGINALDAPLHSIAGSVINDTRDHKFEPMAIEFRKREKAKGQFQIL